jgi:transposase
MLLRHYLEQGTSKSAVARQLGVHRDMIHRWIRDGDLDRDLALDAVRYGPRPPMATKLDAYKPIIEARLATYPELSAVRLLDEIRAAGYAGGYTQLKAFVRRVRPIPAPEPVIRFETPAGHQAQVDFAQFRFAWGVRYALLVVLGYSRQSTAAVASRIDYSRLAVPRRSNRHYPSCCTANTACRWRRAWSGRRGGSKDAIGGSEGS